MALKSFLFLVSVCVSVQAAELDQVSKNKNKIMIAPAFGEKFQMGDRVCVEARGGRKQCGKIIERKGDKVIAQMDEVVEGLEPGDLVQLEKRNSFRASREDSDWEDSSGNIYFRAKGGPSFYSNLDPINSTFGLGLDLGFKSTSGFGISAMGILNLEKNETLTAVGQTVSTDIGTLFLGLSPSFFITQKVFHLSFGLGLGVLRLSQDVSTTPNLGSTTYATASSSRFALVPNVQLDFLLGSNFFLNIGFQYIFSFGDSPKPAFLSPMGGFGYSF